MVWNELRTSSSKRPETIARVQAAIAASPDALVQATKSFADAGINDKTFTAAKPTADFTVAATRMSGIDVAAKYPALPKSVPPKMIPTDHNTSFRCISTFRPSMGSNPLVAWGSEMVRSQDWGRASQRRAQHKARFPTGLTRTRRRS